MLWFVRTENGSTENPNWFFRGNGRVVCNHNVLSLLHKYFARQITRSHHKAIDKGQDQESKCQLLESQAGQVNVILFFFHLQKRRWVYKNPVEYGLLLKHKGLLCSGQQIKPIWVFC